MHLSDGQIKAYLDGELHESELHDIQVHLAACDACRSQKEDILTFGELTRSHVAKLLDGPVTTTISVPAARARLADRLMPFPERNSMWRNLSLTRARQAWAALVVVLLVFVALAFPPVRAIATNFLGLFRVQQIAVVEVNPANFPEQLGSSQMLEQMLSEDIVFDDRGEIQTVDSIDKASALIDLPVRLPTKSLALKDMVVQPGAKATFTVDLRRIQLILSEIQRDDIQLPDNIDGAQVQLEIPAALMAGFGDCDFSHLNKTEEGSALGRQRDCTVLMQMRSPTISAPASLNLPEIGKAFLQMMGLSAGEAEQFSQAIDWTTTLVIPIPQHGATYHEVQVDGRTGTLIRQSYNGKVKNYMLLWVKDDVLYVLTGEGNGDIGVEMGNSMK